MPCRRGGEGRSRRKKGNEPLQSVELNSRFWAHQLGVEGAVEVGAGMGLAGAG